VLKDAQAQGYAETEPSLDIDGFDAQHKIGILASLAHGFWVHPKHIYVEGIRHISRADIQFAKQLGYTIKLLGIIKTTADSHAKSASHGDRDSRIKVATRQGESGVSLSDPRSGLSRPGHVNECLPLCGFGRHRGRHFFLWTRAGKDATASAVLSDLADAADLARNQTPCSFVPHELDGSVVPLAQVVSRCFSDWTSPTS
jgi:homoserine dehydrogenase